MNLLLKNRELALALIVGVMIVGIGFYAPAFVALDNIAYVLDDTSILFMDCSGAELTRRYSETRSRHPMAQDRQIGSQPRNRGLGKRGIFILALVPPVRQRALRVNVDKHDWSGASALGLHGEVTRQRGLARAPLLRCQCEYAQSLIPLKCKCGKDRIPAGDRRTFLILG